MAKMISWRWVAPWCPRYGPGAMRSSRQRATRTVLQQASRVHLDAVVLYDTLPAIEALCAMLHEHVATQHIPVLILHEQVQQMQFTDMVMVDPQYRLGKSPRLFDPHELRRLLDQIGA